MKKVMCLLAIKPNRSCSNICVTVFVRTEKIQAVPKILETPWLCAEGETKKTIPPYKEEIARLLR